MAICTQSHKTTQSYMPNPLRFEQPIPARTLLLILQMPDHFQ